MRPEACARSFRTGESRASRKRWSRRACSGTEWFFRRTNLGENRFTQGRLRGRLSFLAADKAWIQCSSMATKSESRSLLELVQLSGFESPESLIHLFIGGSELH